MKLHVQKRLAASIFRCSQKRVWFDEDRLDDIKESITKQDIKSLIAEGVIRLRPQKSISRFRARKNAKQKAKGLRKGQGSRKGKSTARLPKKKLWMSKIRIQRLFIKKLKDAGLISQDTYRNLYRKSKGGFFRSKRHIKIYSKEQDLFNTKQVK